MLAAVVAAVAIGGTQAPASATKLGILWAVCDDSASLAAASSWVANASSRQLTLASYHGAGARQLCLTHPGPEVPKAWGPHLVARPCDAAAIEQRWTWKDQMLRYMGEPSKAAVCIQADAGPPWMNAPAATWPCPPNASWNTAIARLNSTDVVGAVKLQLNMRVHKLCLSYSV
eukprot:SAG31_NODE_14187_length_822_cov_1.897649_1_plen_172_part_01